ncbi:MAG: thioredoxin domain-containing protein [Nocardioidaceae bacterium]|nr:MAG: thioredoxin domain-containing protein [Nocardioidaceae bacterium]
MAKNNAGKNERSRAARQAAEIRREAAKKEARRRNLAVSAVVLVAIVAIVGIALAIQSGRDSTGASATPPAGAVGDFGVPRGDADAPVEITIFEDFMCPVCGQLEALTRDFLEPAVDNGDVHVIYRPVAFLDRYSNGTKYSTRSVNALAAVLDQSGPEVAAAFHDLLFDNQPQEGTDGLSDEKLIDLAVEAGADRDTISAAIEDRAFGQWVVNATDQASKDGVTGTPTVEIDGERAEGSIAEVAAAMKAAIEAASK